MASLPKVEVKEEKEEEITHETNDWGLCFITLIFFWLNELFFWKRFRK